MDTRKLTKKDLRTLAMIERALRLPRPADVHKARALRKLHIVIHSVALITLEWSEECSEVQQEAL